MLSRTPLLLELDLAQQRQAERERRKQRRERDAERGGKRILFHTGKRPALPRPAQSQAARNTGPGDSDEQGSWRRQGREPVRTGVFMTNNPRRVASMHGVFGHVYAYEVPEGVIRRSGGLRTFDRATELLIPDEDWKHVKFRGKSQDRKNLTVDVDRTTKHVWGVPDRGWVASRPGAKRSKKQQKRDKKASDIARREQGRQQLKSWIELRSPLLVEALRIRRQSSKERLAKTRASAMLGASRASKWLWQKMRKEWSKEHPQYIFRKGRLIFVPPEKRRQMKSKIKGRIVSRAALPGAGTK